MVAHWRADPARVLGGKAWLAEFTPLPTALLTVPWLCQYIVRSDLSYHSRLTRHHNMAGAIGSYHMVP